MMTDPISDMLIRIKNAQAVKHKTVDIPYSKLKYQIANILLKEGFIDKIERKFRKEKKILRIFLKYKNNKPVIQGTPPKGGYGIAIISTSQGLMTAKEARKRKLGGEVICEVW